MEFAARMTGRRLTDSLKGTDLTPTRLHGAAQPGQSVFPFAARPGKAGTAARKLTQSMPALRITGLW
ncbi:WecB/TagA/CpsF family glycosyltransferase [Mameliella sp. MMSF_3455]|uniref:WecB/TagA/CpsF family glycosyltransferase n=1 Tax=Mameliella sp. MMSF_3455 TaxID=3046714 RepID=UPI00273D36B9|nr:WecB/TagA/CpsF family glycosyltransferase [Mameliella sp. MMSF_3455]